MIKWNNDQTDEEAKTEALREIAEQLDTLNASLRTLMSGDQLRVIARKEPGPNTGPL